MASTTYCTWIDTSGEVETLLHKIIEQTSWLKKMTSSMVSFLDLLILIGLGPEEWGSEMHSSQTLEIILFRTIIIVSLVRCVLLKALKHILSC